MAKLDLRLQFILILAGAAGFASACGGDGGDGDDEGTGGTAPIVTTGGTTGVTGGTTGVTGGTTSTGGTGTSAYETTCADFTKCVSTTVVDDFTRDDGDVVQAIPDTFGGEGYWYTWGATGVMITPSKVENAISGGVLDIEVTNTQGTDGGGLGFTLNQSGATGCAADASHFDGIEIVGKTKAASAETYRVKVVMPETVPIAEGGLCTGDGCWGSHEAAVEFPATSQAIQIPWSAFIQPSWGKPKVDFDASKITRIEINPLDADATGFSVVLDSVGFYGTGECDGAGIGGAGGMGGTKN